MPAHAKLYGQRTRLSLGRPGLASFGPADLLDLRREAELLLYSAILESRGSFKDHWRSGARRAGDLFEWLADASSEGAEKLRLLSAGAFQVGGYPALASGVLRDIDGAWPYSRLLRDYLKGDYRGTVVGLTNLWAESASEEVDPDFVVATETVRAIGAVCECLRFEDEGTGALAVEKLEAIANATVNADEQAWLLALTCARQAREVLSSAWTRQVARLTASLSPEGEIAILGLRERAFLGNRSVLWRSQIRGIRRLAQGGSFVLCTPTGSGKSVVAELAIVQSLLATLAGPGSIALYLVPSRALAHEVERTLEREFASVTGALRVTGLYGGTDWGSGDALSVTPQATVLVCTFEKAEALCRFVGTPLLDRVKLIVVDEAHAVQYTANGAPLHLGENRALRLESLVSRLMAIREGAGTRVLALSAVTAGAEGAISQWLAGEHSRPATSKYRSTRQLFGFLECLPSGKTRIQYDLMDRRSLSFQQSGENEAPYVRDPFPAIPPAPSQEEGKTTWLRSAALWAAMHLASRGGKYAGSVLVWIGSHVEYYADAFVTLLEQDWAKQELPSFFVLPAPGTPDRESFDTALRIAADYFGEEASEFKLLRRGIAVHHGKMPAPMARALKEVVEKGVVRVILATATLSEGVNLPVEYVLLPELRRGGQRLTGPEVANVIGRAGRPGARTEGVALAILRPDVSPALRYMHDHYRAIKAELEAGVTESVPSSSLATLMRELRGEWGRLANSNSDGEFEAWLEEAAPEELPDGALTGLLESLDLTVLAGIEELAPEDGRAQVEERLKALWRQTYAYVASKREARLEKWFGVRARAVAGKYDAATRRKYYRSSLPIRTARSLDAQIDSIRERLQGASEYVLWTLEQRLAFLTGYGELLSSVPRFAFDEKSGRKKMDWRAVLSWWLAPGLAAGPSAGEAGAWHSYVSQNFIYRLLWAHGSAIQLLSETQKNVPDGLTLVRGSFDDWTRMGLPWAVLWLRDVVTWGTLEPVAAHLLIEKHASTRPEAHRAAGEYYAQANAPLRDELLDPRSIHAWSSGTAKKAGRVRTGKVAFNVALLAAEREYSRGSYRVLPVRRNGVVEWHTYAGYAVASSVIPADHEHLRSEGNYLLNVATKTVACLS